MSVASFIRGNDFNEFKYFIKAHIPNRKYFISSTGYPAFSKSIPVLVPCGGISSYESGQIGEISDFLFCLEIARYIDSNKEDVFDSLTWRAIQLYNGCIKRQLEAETQSQESIGMFYNAVSCCRNYIHGVNCDIKDLINYANIIIRAEHYFHYTEHYTFKEYLTKLFMPCPNHLIADISQLVNVFIDCFITSGLVRKNSSVICHPWFEPWSSELGGGIADLYLDGVLYDFKSTKKTGYSWEDVGQIYAYYILSQLCAKHPTESSFWANYPVHAISLYYARLGDVETCCLSNSNTMLTESNLDVKALGTMPGT